MATAQTEKMLTQYGSDHSMNEMFKAGRQAGHEDVARELLRYDPSFAHQIAREFLAQHGLKD